jgi:tetratricopeptide (TPR) repeat protein
MPSKEQASAYRKHRTADDKQGNLAWASKVGNRALRVSPTIAYDEVEAAFELDESERVLWRLLRLPRRYTDLEHAHVFAEADGLRAVLRALVAADVVDVVDVSEAKALLPAEVKRLKAELAGKAWRAPVGSLQAKVFRPEIGLESEGSGPSSSMSAPPTVVPVTVPPQSASSSSSSASSAPTALSAEEQKLRASLVAAAAAMATQNHYAFLGVPKAADDAAIRTAYVTLARDYHPDRVAGTRLANDAEVLAAVDKLFKRLGDANKAIANGEARARYDRELSLQESSSAVPAASADGAKRQRRPVEARNAYAMAETFFKRKDFKQAEVHYRQAINFDGEEPMLQVALAWCMFLNPDLPAEKRLGEAKKRLEELAKQTKNGDASYKLGRVLREAGDETGAAKWFEIAVKLSPGHVDAQREVRLIESRREKEKQQQTKSEGGLLGKLFKKP